MTPNQFLSLGSLNLESIFVCINGVPNGEYENESVSLRAIQLKNIFDFKRQMYRDDMTVQFLFI